jgi:hypothetical protein
MNCGKQRIRCKRVPSRNNGSNQDVTRIAEQVCLVQSRPKEKICSLFLIELLLDNAIKFPPLLQAAITHRRGLHAQTGLSRFKKRPARLHTSPVHSALVSVRRVRREEHLRNGTPTDAIRPHHPKE